MGKRNEEKLTIFQKLMFAMSTNSWGFIIVMFILVFIVIYYLGLDPF